MPYANPALPRRANPLVLPLTGVLLVTGGLFLLAWLGWTLVQPAPPLYRYVLDTRGEAGDFPELKPEGFETLPVSRYRLMTEGIDEPLARAYVTDSPDGRPVLLHWDNRVAAPLLYTSTAPAELKAVADTLAAHETDSAGVLGWWDVLQRLEAFTGQQYRFGETLLEPLLIPSHWQPRSGDIAALERSFWRVPGAGTEDAGFSSFTEALLAGEDEAAERLLQLTGTDTVTLVLHVSDIYKLGMLYPGRLGVGYKDFPNTGDMHGLIQRVKDWLQSEGYGNYLVENRGAEVVRVYFLTDEKSTRTLIAKLLPFSKAGPIHLENFELVYQQGGFWVYQLTPVPG